MMKRPVHKRTIRRWVPIVSVAIGVSAPGVWAEPTPPARPEHFAVAMFVEPKLGRAPLTVKFTAETFERQDVKKFHWNFGDGKTASGPEVTHIYKKPGDYTITIDSETPTGAKDWSWETITVLGPNDENFD